MSTPQNVALMQLLDWQRAQKPKTPEEELQRAGEARALLDSKMFREARERVEGGIAAKRREVPLRDTDMHTRLILMEQLWMQIISFLEQTAQTGRFAELKLRQDETLRQRMNFFSR